MKILFIQTGGTIDKDYPKLTKGYAFEIGEPAIERILARIKPAFDFEIISLLKKDSQEITNNDRKIIFDKCTNTNFDKIIITHGTDTMIETAKYLSPIKNKTVILTGAMKPERFKESDADFNVGTAIGAIGNIPYGVFIAMKGEVIPADEAKRDFDTGKFIRITRP
jgi:L-asparaginase